jgi:hypothetical protein
MGGGTVMSWQLSLRSSHGEKVTSRPNTDKGASLAPWGVEVEVEEVRASRGAPIIAWVKLIR